MQTKLLGRQGSAGLDYTPRHRGSAGFVYTQAGQAPWCKGRAVRMHTKLPGTGAVLVFRQIRLPGTGAVLVLAIFMQTKLPGTRAVLYACKPSFLAQGQCWC